jgi:hypothetical protein
MASHRTLVVVSLVALAVLLPAGFAVAQSDAERAALTEVWSPVPPVVTPGAGTAPPSDAIVLFDGTDLSQWQDLKGGPPRWTVAEGAVTVAPKAGDIRTKRGFGDCQLHVEWRAPAVVKGESQGRGNSGVFLQDRYEVQVLDSFENKTYPNGQVASLYKQHIPLVNASRRPGEWQTYDIFYTAPRFADDGQVRSPAYVTVLHNGVLVQHHVALKGTTQWIGQPRYEKHGPAEPIRLQDHGDLVSYRNIWIRELRAPGQDQ